MLELVIFVIFVISFGGVLFILARKIPTLNSLPQNGSAGIREHHIISNIDNRMKKIFVFFEKQIYLHKFLSWTKVMTLKIETKIDVLLRNIRKKSQQSGKK
ncbi:MAG: hypothetical protein NT155_04100 [Candidatus Staskawiczbacteria bacterium]|nr:hypothetical protein [Candidatus Staskawiczbacteria bacterium]